MNHTGVIMQSEDDLENQQSNNQLCKQSNNKLLRNVAIVIVVGTVIGILITGIVYISHHNEDHDHHDEDHDH